jgi:FAD-dependent urate hydroxylase
MRRKNGTALVIGAGIAGPAMSMAPKRAGIEPLLFEAHQAGASGVGSFLTVTSNGVDALDARVPQPCLRV